MPIGHDSPMRSANTASYTESFDLDPFINLVLLCTTVAAVVYVAESVILCMDCFLCVCFMCDWFDKPVFSFFPSAVQFHFVLHMRGLPLPVVVVGRFFFLFLILCFGSHVPVFTFLKHTFLLSPVIINTVIQWCHAWAKEKNKFQKE